MYSGLQYEQGRFTFIASNPGAYQICFNNEMARWTAKVVQFFVDIEGVTPQKKVSEGRDKVITGMCHEVFECNTSEQTQKHLNEISQNLEQAKDDQRYLRTREQRHRDSMLIGDAF